MMKRSVRVLFKISLLLSLVLVTTVFAAEMGDESALPTSRERAKSGGIDSDMVYLAVEIVDIDGIEMVRLRELAEEFEWSLGFKVKTKEIIIRKNGQEIIISVEKGTVDGKKVAVTPVIKKGRTYLAIDMVKMLTGRIQGHPGKIMIVSLDTDKEEYRPEEEIKAYIRAINISEETINLDFSSGQKYDLYLQKEGEEIWRWSEGKFFTMALQRLELAPGERLGYDIKILKEKKLAPGNYTLYGELSTVKSPVKLNKVELTIK